MKEGHNLSYVTKIGAYGFAVVAAFAVALAVLLSVSSTSTVEAALQSKTNDTFSSHDGNARNGDTLYVQNSASTYVKFEIETAGSASAAFTHSDASEDGQTILCRDADAAGTCDEDAAGQGVTVALKIDTDSGKGVVFVKQTVVATNAVTSDEISVTVAQVPTKLTAKLASKSINSGQGTATAGTTHVDIRLTDENGAGIASKAVTIVSTRAVLATATNTSREVGSETVTLTGYTGAQLAGSVTTTVDADANDDTDTRGYARVQVTGGGAPGISTITITLGELTATVDLVLHGAVKTISAEVEQSAIEVGGKTRIVVTAVDSAGNPVADQNVSIKSKGGVTPPVKLATAVVPSVLVNKDGGTVGSLADKGDIPACGDVDAEDGDADADPPEAAVAESTGTDGDGQCVIQISAPDDTGTANDAARGTHTIVIVAGDSGTAPKGVDAVTIEIQVGGAPSTIESDAPERIDPSDEITINVTVLDDEVVRVGGVKIEAIQTAGDGAVITEIGSRTSDGRAKFTYLAPSTPGVVEFLVRTRADSNNAVTAKLPIIIQIAEAMDEPVTPVEPPVTPVEPPVTPVEPPVMEDATLSGSAGLAIFSGGSLDDLESAALALCPGGAAVWADDGSGTGGYILYTAGASLSIVNNAFAAVYPDGLDQSAVIVTRCEADVMENEN